LKPGQRLTLKREPNNEFDNNAIAVFGFSGEQLGYLPGNDILLANHMDMGGVAYARVVEVIGGPGLLGFFNKANAKSYGCIIDVVKGEIDHSATRPFFKLSSDIGAELDRAKKLEKEKPEEAVAIYRKAIEDIIALDMKGTMAKACRRSRYPINRLTMILVELKKTQEAYDEILKWQAYDDCLGILRGDKASTEKRKLSLETKLGMDKN
tara:strand:+ start:245106 stop:245732 length:627 start_codon:yes stop_codon:yes gene_type:complete